MAETKEAELKKIRNDFELAGEKFHKETVVLKQKIADSVQEKEECKEKANVLAKK